MSEGKRKVYSLPALLTDQLRGVLQAGESQPLWRVLVYNKEAELLVRMLFKVGDLRDMNITLHLPLASRRERLHGVMCLYLLSPDRASVDRVIQDFKKELYSSVRLYFITEPAEQFFTSLAEELRRAVPASLRSIGRVASVPCGFTPLDKQMFMAGPEGLTDFCRVLGLRPCLLLHNDLKEEVGEGLRSRLRGVGQNCSGTNIVVVVPREQDLSPVLCHSWFYGAMLHQILGINGGTVAGRIDGAQVEHFLDWQDPLWLDNVSTPLPNFVQIVNSELRKWNVESIALQGSGGNFGEALQNAPELGERRKRIDRHIALIGRLLQQVKERNLAKLHELGSTVISKGVLKSSQLKQLQALLQTASDKDAARFLTLYAESADDLTDLTRLRSLNPKIDCFGEGKTLLDSVVAKRGLPQQTTGVSGLFKGLAKHVGKHSKNLLRQLYDGGTRERVVQLVYKVAMCEAQQLAASFRNEGGLERELGELKAITVYYVGGGSYHEHSRLGEVRQKTTFPVYYGCDRVARPSDYV